MTEQHKSPRKILGELSLVESLYDYIRIVDPLNKKVENYLKSPEQSSQAGHRCYSIWGRGDLCENCISVRAFNQKDTFIKIDCQGGEVWMAAATPAVVGGRRVVVELLKNITETGILDIEGKEAGQIHRIIDRKNRQIITDPLAKIYNSRFIYERLPYDISRADENNKALTLIFIRLNNYEHINTVYGRAAGNYAVKVLAGILRKSCRANMDWAARYGGAEFIMVLSDTDEKEAYRICKRLYAKINGEKFSYGGKQVEVKAGVGYHTLQRGKITPDEFVQKAEKSMFITSPQDKEKEEAIAMARLEQMFLLTLRESEVAKLLLEGLSNLEIAGQIFVSGSTVKKHISSIYKKTKVKSRSEFISRYGYLAK